MTHCRKPPAKIDSMCSWARLGYETPIPGLSPATHFAENLCPCTTAVPAAAFSLSLASPLPHIAQAGRPEQSAGTRSGGLGRDGSCADHLLCMRIFDTNSGPAPSLLCTSSRNSSMRRRDSLPICSAACSVAARLSLECASEMDPLSHGQAGAAPPCQHRCSQASPMVYSYHPALPASHNISHPCA